MGDAITDPVMEAACQALARTPLQGESNLYASKSGSLPSGGSERSLSVRELCDAEVVGYDPNLPEALTRACLVVLYHRRADLNALPAAIRQAPVLYEYALRGVWLARVVRLPPLEKAVD